MFVKCQIQVPISIGGILRKRGELVDIPEEAAHGLLKAGYISLTPTNKLLFQPSDDRPLGVEQSHLDIIRRTAVTDGHSTHEESQAIYSCCRVTGGWFWGVWTSEQDFIKSLKIGSAPFRYGVAVSREAAITEAQRYVSISNQEPKSAWWARRSYDHLFGQESVQRDHAKRKVTSLRSSRPDSRPHLPKKHAVSKIELEPKQVPGIGKINLPQLSDDQASKEGLSPHVPWRKMRLGDLKSAFKRHVKSSRNGVQQTRNSSTASRDDFDSETLQRLRDEVKDLADKLPELRALKNEYAQDVCRISLNRDSVLYDSRHSGDTQESYVLALDSDGGVLWLMIIKSNIVEVSFTRK